MVRRNMSRVAWNSRGDTIVEVMIVLAVLSLAISISYATATKSLLAERAAQESAYATNLLQNQVETLRVLSTGGLSAPANKNIFIAGPFCVKGGNVVLASVADGCSAGLDDDNRYTVNIRYDVPGATTGTFVLKATWDDVSGKPPKDSATIVYKVPNPQ